jgi:hypothetical protein
MGEQKEIGRHARKRIIEGKKKVMTSIAVLDTLYFTEEFCVIGYINSQNSHIRKAENPEQPFNSLKFGVSCEISRRRVIGPLLFSETVISDNYEQLIGQFISSGGWYYRHGASSAPELLHEFFGSLSISRNA